METKTQDPKYIIIDGALANASTREFIPEDEPIFILRAKDICALPTILQYAGFVNNEEHKRAVNKRVTEFHNFSANNPDRMHMPDTEDFENWEAYSNPDGTEDEG